MSSSTSPQPNVVAANESATSATTRASDHKTRKHTVIECNGRAVHDSADVDSDGHDELEAEQLDEKNRDDEIITSLPTDVKSHDDINNNSDAIKAEAAAATDADAIKVVDADQPKSQLHQQQHQNQNRDQHQHQHQHQHQQANQASGLQITHQKSPSIERDTSLASNRKIQTTTTINNSSSNVTTTHIDPNQQLNASSSLRSSGSKNKTGELVSALQSQLSRQLTNQLQEQQQQQHHHQLNNKSLNNNNTFISAPISTTTLSTLPTQATQALHSQNTNRTNSPTSQFSQQDQAFCKRRRLSYLQALLLRKWPCLALTICIMTSLVVGLLLSVVTVFVVYNVADCNGLKASPLRPSDLLETFTFGGELNPLANADKTPSIGLAPPAPGDALNGPTSLADTSRPLFQRLPSSIKPIHYELFFQPFIAEPFKFNGKVSIRVKCLQATDNITLHANELQIDEKSLKLTKLDTNSTGHGRNEQQQQHHQVVRIKSVKRDDQLQYVIFQLNETLPVESEYELSMDFVGILNDDLAGFYKIRYDQVNSTEPTWIAATQFQATDARRAFPCFDEPAYKATFGIKIKHWRNMTALSNMPIIDSRISQDKLWVTDTFEKSAIMSTYLVAFCVTNFESRREGNITVWARPGFAHTADYSLRIAGKILRHYEKFFGIEYPLPKMDMIALPDFNAGAMENWGLITYRETAMLYDENVSTLGNKQRIAEVVAHELAHQWFGNLVTPKWWDDLWLNEGFASYVEYIGVDHVEPSWRMLDQFVGNELHDVFRMDSLSSTHQISIPVNNPDEISEIFDRISYGKGASVIRMMNYFITEPVFKAGLRDYLSALKFNNAEQADLWRYLSKASALASNSSNTNAKPVDVGYVMNSWTLQSGYPLVTLKRDYDGRMSAQLDQVRYEPIKTSRATNNNSQVSNKSPNDSSSPKWEIPITLTWQSEANFEPTTRLWLHQNDSKPVALSRDLIPDNDDEWMLVNVNQVGYYRVNYDLRNWKLLINQLRDDHTRISTVNRAQILDDIFELARSATLDYKLAMETTKYLRKEQEFMPWDAVLNSFAYIDDMLSRTPMYGDWRDYLSHLIAPYYARYRDLEWSLEANQTIDKKVATQTDLLEHFSQQNAVGWSCQVNEHCISKAKASFEAWKRTGINRIIPALRYTVYCTAIENGNRSDWDFIWKVFETEQNPTERDRLMRSLACTKETWLLSRYVEFTFSKTKHIRRQDGALVFRLISKNNYGRDIAFNYMRERWPTIRDQFGKSSFSMGYLVRAVGVSMNTQTELNQLINFYETVKHDLGAGKRAFQLVLEEVESNVQWRNRNYQVLEDWIREAKREFSKQTRTQKSQDLQPNDNASDPNGYQSGRRRIARHTTV